MLRLVRNILALLLVAILMTAGAGYRLQTLLRGSTADIYNRKNELLRQVPSPRIILVGGSNVLYGLDSAVIERQAGMPAFNMGLTASVGLHFILNNARGAVGKGDIVLLAPEYELLQDTAQYYGNVELVYMIAHNPDLSPHIADWRQLLYLLPRVPSALVAAEVNETALFNPDITDRGDFVWEEISIRRETKLPKPALDRGIGVRPAVMADLLRFKTALEQAGATLYISPPYLPAEHFLVNRAAYAAVYRQFVAHGFTLLAEPESATLSAHYFYDTTYHLNAVGRIIRSEQVGADLKKRLPASRQTM